MSGKIQMVTRERALPGRDAEMPVPERHAVLGTRLAPPYPEGCEQALFGLGCFWGAERKFWQIPGVHTTAVGYTGGFTPNPTYREVCSGMTGHTEAVLVVFDPTRVGYEALLATFWESHDPTQGMRQGNDVGTQYRSAIFFHSPEQEQAAREVIGRLSAEKLWGAPIVTEVVPAATFWRAEDYHQEYFERVGSQNPYCTFVVEPKVAKFRKHFTERLKRR
jgi:peptide-methionine (S)-S-oxide reductase